MPNRLSEEASLYLRQHAENPIDWYPWGDEAFSKARLDDKPVFLSVGYSSCHWCHVMAHESFEDPEVAAALNAGFISIKVDREERPDVDEIYMSAVQMANGHGGWPMSLFLTSDRRPFFAGTYFPKVSQKSAPGFLNLIYNIQDLWKRKRSEIEETAEQFAQALKQIACQRAPAVSNIMDRRLLQAAIPHIIQNYDPLEGGFGTHPKFPPHSTIRHFLLLSQDQEISEEVRQQAYESSLFTLEKMALGGITDHVGGGCHRYSTDERWLLPHFEKMLSDNAQFLANWVLAAKVTRDQRQAALFDRRARQLVEWLRSEMLAPDGSFYSAIDADSEGQEGKFYLWSTSEVGDTLGDRASGFLAAYGITEYGNYLDEATHQRTGLNVLHLVVDDQGAFDSSIHELRLRRLSRTRPATDTKALASWNGLMICALVKAQETELANRAFLAWKSALEDCGFLPQQIQGGTPSGRAFLDGVASMCLAAEAVGDGNTRDELRELMIREFYDDENGGFTYSGSEHEELFGRSMPGLDHAVPSANAQAIEVLIQAQDFERAERTLSAMLGWMQRFPGGSEGLQTSLLLYLKEAPSGNKIDLPAQVSAPSSLILTLERSELTVNDEGWAEGLLKVTIPLGKHINSHDPVLKWLTPTRLIADAVESYAAYPDAPNDRLEGEIEIPFRIKDPKKTTEFQLTLKYQMCTESECFLPDQAVVEGIVIS